MHCCESLDASRQGLRFVTLRYTPGYHPTPSGLKTKKRLNQPCLCSPKGDRRVASG